MKKFMWIIILIVFTFPYSPPSALAQFEDLGVGARGIGMGNAFTGLADDGYTIYYNPAGLGRIEWQELVMDYGKLYWGLDDNSNLGQSFIGYAQSVGRPGTVGLGWVNLALTRYYREDTFILAYGRKIYSSEKDLLRAGTSLKILSKAFRETAYTENAVNLDTGETRGGKDPVFEDGYSRLGFSCNLGIIYELGKRHSFGLAINDINQPDMGLSTKDRVALGAKLGYAYRGKGFNMATDVIFKKRDINFVGGAEKWFVANKVGIRWGLGIGSREYANGSVGASYRYDRLVQFDYCFVYPLRGISNFYGSHRFSLTLRFGIKGPEERDLERELREIRAELELAKQEAEKARFEAEELLKAKEISEARVRQAEQKQREAEQKVKRLEEQLHALRQKFQTEIGKATRDRIIREYYDKGLSHYQKHEYEGAIAEFEKVLELDPNHIDAKRLIKEAKEKLEQQTKQRVENHYKQALKAYYDGKLNEAIEELESALKLDPENEDARILLERTKREIQLRERR